MVRAAALALLAVAPEMHVTGTVRGHTGASNPLRLPAAVAFFTPRDGVLSFPDGRLLRTRDGGRTWMHGRGASFDAADVVTRRIAFACTDARSCAADAGRSWRRIGVLPFAGGLDFADARHGCLAGRGGARSTADGGRTWRPLRASCGSRDSVH